jgi:hypothetical protein
LREFASAANTETGKPSRRPNGKRNAFERSDRT